MAVPIPVQQIYADNNFPEAVPGNLMEPQEQVFHPMEVVDYGLVPGQQQFDFENHEPFLNLEDLGVARQQYSDEIYDACDSVLDFQHPMLATVELICDTEKKIFGAIERLFAHIKVIAGPQLAELLADFFAVYRRSFERCVSHHDVGSLAVESQLEASIQLRIALTNRLVQWNAWYDDGGVHRFFSQSFRDPGGRWKARLEAVENEGMQQIKNKLQRVQETRQTVAELERQIAEQHRANIAQPLSAEEAKAQLDEERRAARLERAKEKRIRKDLEILKTVSFNDEYGTAEGNDEILARYKAKCSKCNFRFTETKFVNIHSKIFHQMVFFCHYCERTFASHGPLRVHCDNQHPGLKVDPDGRRAPEQCYTYFINRPDSTGSAQIESSVPDSGNGSIDEYDQISGDFPQGIQPDYLPMEALNEGQYVHQNVLLNGDHKFYLGNIGQEIILQPQDAAINNCMNDLLAPNVAPNMPMQPAVPFGAPCAVFEPVFHQSPPALQQPVYAQQNVATSGGAAQSGYLEPNGQQGPAKGISQRGRKRVRSQSIKQVEPKKAKAAHSKSVKNGRSKSVKKVQLISEPATAPSSEPEPAKRKRGRPRKNPVQQSVNSHLGEVNGACDESTIAACSPKQKKVKHITQDGNDVGNLEDFSGSTKEGQCEPVEPTNEANGHAPCSEEGQTYDSVEYEEVVSEEFDENFMDRRPYSACGYVEPPMCEFPRASSVTGVSQFDEKTFDVDPTFYGEWRVAISAAKRDVPKSDDSDKGDKNREKECGNLFSSQGNAAANESADSSGPPQAAVPSANVENENAAPVPPKRGRGRPRKNPQPEFPARPKPSACRRPRVFLQKNPDGMSPKLFVEDIANRIDPRMITENLFYYPFHGQDVGVPVFMEGCPMRFTELPDGGFSATRIRERSGPGSQEEFTITTNPNNLPRTNSTSSLLKIGGDDFINLPTVQGRNELENLVRMLQQRSENSEPMPSGTGLSELENLVRLHIQRRSENSEPMTSGNTGKRTASSRRNHNAAENTSGPSRRRRSPPPNSSTRGRGRPRKTA